MPTSLTMTTHKLLPNSCPLPPSHTTTWAWTSYVNPLFFFLLDAAWVRSRAERPSVSYTKVTSKVAWTGHNLQFTKTNLNNKIAAATNSKKKGGDGKMKRMLEPSIKLIGKTHQGGVQNRAYVHLRGGLMSTRCFARPGTGSLCLVGRFRGIDRYHAYTGTQCFAPASADPLSVFFQSYCSASSRGHQEQTSPQFWLTVSP